MDNRQGLHPRLGSGWLIFLAAVLAGTCAAYLQTHVPIAYPNLVTGEGLRHWVWLAGAIGLVVVVDLVAIAAAFITGRRLHGTTTRIRAPRTPLWVAKLPALFLRVATAASYGLLLTTAVLGLPTWEVIASSLVPWLVVLPFATVWFHRRYGPLAVLAAVTLLQLGTLAEHLSQVVELFATDGNGAVAKGVFGQINAETVAIASSGIVWIGAAVLAVRFARNPWLWAAVAIASISAAEHLYVYSLFAGDNAFWAGGGVNGILAVGGLVNGPLSRPYLELLVSLATSVALIGALVGEARPAIAFPRVSLPRRIVGTTMLAMFALPSLLLACATVGVGASPVLCRNVAQQAGLDFTNPYGATLATDPMGRLWQRNMGQGAAVGDYTGDGYLDVYLLGQQGMPSRLYRNVPAPGGGRRFIDVTTQAGLAGQRGLGRVAFFADLAGTGRPDLIVLNDYMPGTGLQPSKIYRNNGDGTFTDVTEGSGFDPEGYLVGGASLADFFGDGRLDIYVSYWTMDLGAESPFHLIQGRFPGHNQLFRNLGGYRFQDVTDQVGIGRLTRDSFSSVAANFGQTGKLGLFQAIDHRTNLLFENKGGQLQEVSQAMGVDRRGNNMGVAAAGLGGTSLIDIYTTDISDPTGDYGTTQGNGLFIAQRRADGSVFYTNQADARGVGDTGWGWGAAFIDMRLHGRLDLFAAQGMREMLGMDSPLFYGRSRLFLNDGSNHFASPGGTGCDILGDQRAVVPFDFNRDGAPDILVTQVNGPVQLLENQTSGPHWLTVDLSRSGAEAAGAEVTVTAGGRSTTQLVLLGGSYLAGPPLEAYFGLGDSTRAESVTVRWADGKETALQGVAANQLLRVAR